MIAEGGRRQVYAEAIDIADMRAVRWLEEGRIPLGGFSLLAGREGVGKSILWAHLAAQITQGTLPGHWFGQPRAVLVAATEDSWATTITPRLMAAGADFALIRKLGVHEVEFDSESTLSLPDDLPALEGLILQFDVALVVFDPLLSRLDVKLDSHKDAEVRRALEPLSAIADATGATMLGLLHVNKTSTTDPLTSLMGSRAFPAVARAVVYMAYDSDDEGVRLVGTPKNNVGPTDSTTRTSRIENVLVGIDPDGLEIRTGKLVFTGTRNESIREALEESAGSTAESRTNRADAAEWLHEWLVTKGGSAPSTEAKQVGAKMGHLSTTLTHALRRAGVRVERVGFPSITTWTILPVGSSSGEGDLTDSTNPTDSTGLQSGQSGHLGQSGKSPTRGDLTGNGYKPSRALRSTLKVFPGTREKVHA